jgi:hypothetical protein
MAKTTASAVGGRRRLLRRPEYNCISKRFPRGPLNKCKQSAPAREFIRRVPLIRTNFKAVCGSELFCEIVKSVSSPINSKSQAFAACAVSNEEVRPCQHDRSCYMHSISPSPRQFRPSRQLPAHPLLLPRRHRPRRNLCHGLTFVSRVRLAEPIRIPTHRRFLRLCVRLRARPTFC